MKKQLLSLFIFVWAVLPAFEQTETPVLPTKHISAQTQRAIQATKQGCRPEPKTYLSAKYLEMHANLFKEGASYLVPKDVLDRFGRKLLGRPDGQFVMTKKEMDRLLGKKGANLAYIEKQLGIPAGAWVGKTLVRIDILPENLQKLNLRIPSGNEAAANNLWIPGGKLPTGYTEGVVNQIPEGSYNETVLELK
jgi:hypothetical protein